MYYTYGLLCTDCGGGGVGSASSKPEVERGSFWYSENNENEALKTLHSTLDISIALF